MLILITTLIHNEYLCMTKFVPARNVQTEYNMKVKPRSQILRPESGFLVLVFRSFISCHGTWFLNFESLVVGLG